jgi:hypothetical protein
MLTEKLKRAKLALPKVKETYIDLTKSLDKESCDEWARAEKLAQLKRQTGTTVERADDMSLYDVTTSKGLSLTWGL